MNKTNQTNQINPPHTFWWWISAHDGGYQQGLSTSLSIRLHFARKTELFLRGDAGTLIAFQEEHQHLNQ